MCAMEKAYAVFGRLMCEDKVYLDRALTFPRICEWLDVKPEALDEVLLSELGYDGAGLLAAYREQEASYLSEKYGLNVFF